MSTRRDLVANYLGSAWAALMGFVFVPFYLKFIGAEGYGLVGFFVLLSAFFGMLDGGMGAAATRESARFSAASDEERAHVVTMLRTMERLFWSAAILAGLGIALCAPLLVDHWLNVSESMRPDTVIAVRWMALAVAVQFPLAFYGGCLNGLRRQVALNAMTAIGATVRSGGAALALWLISPTVDTFFLWHVVSGGLLLAVQRFVTLKELNKTAWTGQLSLKSLGTIRNFLGGVGTINILSLLLTQVDKIILSKVLPLAEFGYYTLAWTLGTLIYRITGPIFVVYYPRLIVCIERGDKPGLLLTYRTSWTLLAALVVPLSLWLAFFSGDVLVLWTQNHEIAQAASVALTLIALGSMCNALMHMPYAMQLAHGVTRLALLQNIATLLVIAPLTWILATRYGMTAAAIPWLLVNASYLVISPTLMHRILALDGLAEWYAKGVAVPLIASTPVLIAAWFFWEPQPQQKLVTAIVLSLILAGACITSLAIAWPRIRTRN